MGQIHHVSTDECWQMIQVTFQACICTVAVTVFSQKVTFLENNPHSTAHASVELEPFEGRLIDRSIARKYPNGRYDEPKPKNIPPERAFFVCPMTRSRQRRIVHACVCIPEPSIVNPFFCWPVSLVALTPVVKATPLRSRSLPPDRH